MADVLHQLQRTHFDPSGLTTEGDELEGDVKPEGSHPELKVEGRSAGDSLVGLALVERGPFRPALVAVDQPQVIQSEQIENGGVQVVDMQAVFDSVQAQFIGGADHLSAFDA